MRQLSRFIHGQMSAWRQGRCDATYRSNEWILRRGLKSELRRAAAIARALQDLKQAAIAAAVEMPWATAAIVADLQRHVACVMDLAGGGSADGPVEAAVGDLSEGTPSAAA